MFYPWGPLSSRVFRAAPSLAEVKAAAREEAVSQPTKQLRQLEAQVGRAETRRRWQRCTRTTPRQRLKGPALATIAALAASPVSGAPP